MKKIKKFSKSFSSKAVRLIMIGALIIDMLYPLITVFAAGSTYTITYKDSNGTVLGTQTANAGDTVTLNRNYPASAIAWVDNDDTTVKSVNSNAKGRGYVNYSLNDPNNSSPAASNMKMTMPNRNVTLFAFYGNYQNGNEPREIQYHLELKYHDVSSGYDLSYDQQYRNINAPAGYVINLPDENYFSPITGIASNPATGERNPFESGLTIYKWVADASYTGTTTEPDDKLFNPSALIYVDPNNYNMIYDVMVDQTKDYITGGEVTPPALPDITNPEIPNVTDPSKPKDEPVKIIFQIDNKAPIGAGFTYNDGSNSGTITNPDKLEYELAYGTTWGDMLGYGLPGTQPPQHLTVLGYTEYYWTQDDGKAPINLVLYPDTPITKDCTFTLHYIQDMVTVVFNFDTKVYDSDGSVLTDGTTATSIGAGFEYRDSTHPDGDTIMAPNQLTYQIPYGSTWSDFFGSNIMIPTHLNIEGYSSFYWTEDGGDEHIGSSSIAMNSKLTKDYVFTLSYQKDPKEIVVKLNTATYEYDGNSHKVQGFAVVKYDGTKVDYEEDLALHKAILTEYGISLDFVSGRDFDYKEATEVGTYQWGLPRRDFAVYSGSTNITKKYKITVLTGQLTITPAGNDIVVDPIVVDPDEGNNTDEVTNIDEGNNAVEETPNNPKTNDINIPFIIFNIIISGAGILFLSKDMKKRGKATG